MKYDNVLIDIHTTHTVVGGEWKEVVLMKMVHKKAYIQSGQSRVENNYIDL